jgi:hypothetical protein
VRGRLLLTQSSRRGLLAVSRLGCPIGFVLAVARPENKHWDADLSVKHATALPQEIQATANTDKVCLLV